MPALPPALAASLPGLSHRRRLALALLIALAGGALGAVALFDPAGSGTRVWAYLLGRVEVLRGGWVFLAGIALVITLEAAWAGYEGSSLSRLLRPTRSTWIDIACFVLQRLGLYGLLTWIFTLSAASVVPRLLRETVPEGALSFANPWLQYLWLIVAMDFVRYVIHWLQHRVPFWWQAHAFHHCATELNAITTARAHPVDHGLQLVFQAVPFALLGGSMLDFVLVSLMLAMHAGLTHTMLPWDFGWIGRWVLVSPVAHRIHHSDLPEHHDRNMGHVFIIWDRIFGTWYDGRVINATVGIADNPYNRDGMVADLLSCARRTYGAVLAPLWRRGRVIVGGGTPET